MAESELLDYLDKLCVISTKTVMVDYSIPKYDEYN